MRRTGTTTLAILLGLSLAGCGKVNIINDFSRPFEQEGILMPQSTRAFVLSTPGPVTVDIGIDFDDNETRTDRLRLLVDDQGFSRVGAPVPGSQMQHAVCGVRLSASGTQVEVQNLNTMRSAPYSLRVERSPSALCQPIRIIPNTATASR